MQAEDTGSTFLLFCNEPATSSSTIFMTSQVKEYGTVPAGIRRKSPEHSARKISDHLPVLSRQKLVGNHLKNPEIFLAEYCFHVPMTFGVFLQHPVFFPSLSCRFLRDLVTGIFHLGINDSLRRRGASM